MRTTTTAFAMLVALTGCSENDFHDIDDTDDDVVVDRPDVGGNGGSYVPPEEPRFHLLEIPYSPGVSENGVVLLSDFMMTDVYTWTETEGLEWRTTTVIRENTPNDISDDGTTIIGSYGNFYAGETTQAATWTEAAGWVKLGALETTGDCPSQSNGYSMAADGSLIGLGWVNGCQARAIRWDATNGMVAYEEVGNGGNRASAVSDNGALAVGFAQSSSRTPAVWYADGTGEVINMAWMGEFYGVNADGTKAVGQFGTKAGVWSPGVGHTFLGILGQPGQSSSTAYDICGADSDLIIGKDTFGGGTATAWTEETGLVPMADYLAELGLELPENTKLDSADHCTNDKRYIVGHGSVDDRVGVWVAILPDHLFETP